MMTNKNCHCLTKIKYMLTAYTICSHYLLQHQLLKSNWQREGIGEENQVPNILLFNYTLLHHFNHDL